MTLIFLLSSGPASAVEVEPTRLELTVPADAPVSGELQISNRGGKPVEVRMSTGAYRFQDPDVRLPSCQEWFKFQPERLTLAPGASTTVIYTVTPPDNVGVDTAGEYLAAVLVDQLPAEPAGPAEEGKSRLTIVPRMALAAYVMIQGREKVDVELSGLQASRVDSESVQLIGRDGPSGVLRLDVALQNNGTVHVRPSGTYGLFHEDGRLYNTAPLGKAMPLLPSVRMEIPALLPMPPAGKYRCVVTMEVKEGIVLQKESSFEVTSEGEILQGNAA